MNTDKLIELQRHIEDIGAELGCDIDWVYDNIGGMMYVEEEPPRIEIPNKQVWDEHPEKCYFVSLHELGHVYFNHTQGRPPHETAIWYFKNGVLKSEAEAWKFALNNSIIEFNEYVLDFALNRCIMSYYMHYVILNGQKTRLTNGNRHHVEFVYDEPDDFFWSVCKELGYKDNV